MASTAVSPSVKTTDCPAFKVADTRSVATDAFCRRTMKGLELAVARQMRSVYLSAVPAAFVTEEFCCVTLYKQATWLACTESKQNLGRPYSTSLSSSTCADLAKPVV